MKVLPYPYDHSAGDTVYLLGKFTFGKPDRKQTLLWGKPYVVERTSQWKHSDGSMRLGIVLEDHPNWVFEAEQFVNLNTWMLIDLAVNDIIYSNKN